MVPTSGKRHIVLVGSMGVGKTTAAQLVADRLDWAVEDDDVDRPSHLASARGEDEPVPSEAPPQPEEEAGHLLRVLDRSTPTVVGTAAGVVDGLRCREALREARVVWLRARPDTVAQRLQTDGAEGLGPDVTQALTALAKRRIDNYRRVADLVIDTDDLSEGQVVDRIIAWLAGQGETAAVQGGDIDLPREPRADELPGNDDRLVDPDLESILAESRPADAPLDDERAAPAGDDRIPDEPGRDV